MNNDQLMVDALGDYFDSLLTEPSSPDLKPRESMPLAADAVDDNAIMALEVKPEQESVQEPEQEPEALAPLDDEFAAFEDAVRQERLYEQQQALIEPTSQIVEPVKPKPLEALLAEAQQRISTPVAEPLPAILPIVDLPEQAPHVDIEPEVTTDVELQAAAAEPEKAEWENVVTDDDFQVLFFELAGVTFGVPLTQLGGIHRLTEISPLFGKPNWFSGIMIDREKKLSVVDTAKWVMPGQPFDPEYKYMVMLGDSHWGLSCEKLLGTERILRSDVKWRQQAGSRPWLAGMVKKKMCALLHVDELESLLEKGVDIDGH